MHRFLRNAGSLFVRTARAGKKILQRPLSAMRSIRFRLTAWSVLILAVILLAFSVFVYLRQQRDIRLESLAELQLKTRQAMAVFRLSEGMDPDPGTKLKAAITDREVMALVDPSGMVTQTAGNPDTNTIDQIIHYAQQSIGNNDAGPYLTASHYPEGNGRHSDYVFVISPLVAERRFAGLLILGAPVDPTNQLPRLALTLLLGSLATLAIVLAGGYWLAGKALSPVRTITRTARGISESDLHQRLHLNTQDELGELANTFDAMLERLEAAFIRQRQFTADASHELRTPLAIIGLEADQTLSRRRNPDEYERSLQLIRSENEYMARLVNDLLTLARMDAGQVQLQEVRLDLSEVALDVIERLSSLARRDGVTLHAGELPEAHVVGDYQYLSQMLINLVQNAMKYAGGKGHNVWVETGTVSQQNQAFAWARVTDDGPGIPAEHLPHLFDRFYRVDKARSRREDAENEPAPDGSGLGLAIVQWIVQAHHGTVSVESELRKGTSFEVCIPLDQAEAGS